MERIVLLTVIVILGYVVALALDYRVTKKEKEEMRRCKKVDKYCDYDDN
ncbi:TPA: hypothetical protein IXN57_000416 [Enterococcus faecium]|nr:hypothetical protein [Enterococcus faecium]EOH45627.1 hypothetical protein SSI_01667 [Enterococcus faecium EnGen0191]HAQ3640926.1 hypothetical protein [Enterococcus faecium]HCU0013959.1 hypothetical protein [Enterococcus faecium]